MAKIRTYSEMMSFDSFDERFEYLKLGGYVGESTFGFDRYINQRFYTSRQWKDVRDYVLVRDNGCDLGIDDYQIFDSPIIHHINPMGVNDIMHGESWILDPEYLITVSHRTHNAIHYGADILIPNVVTERSLNDTKLW